MRTLRNFARIIIAPVFIFSGFVKAIDPLGSTYKFSDYFEAFGMDFMMPVSFGLAILLSTAELVIGLALLMGVLMRITAWALMLFMSFFTVLTLIIAIYNPVTDCGCFGDAILLTNWQTFWKNIVFMVPTLIVFFSRFMYRPISNVGTELGIVSLFVVIGIGISVTTYHKLPFIDFRPYKIGTNVPSSMIIPDGSPVDEYEAIFVYEQNGVQQEFKAEDIPYQDTTWKYVDRQTTLIKKGYEPPIHDFSLTTLDGNEITDSLLTDPGYSFLVISYNLEEASDKGLKNINDFVASLGKQAVSVYGMTASTNSIINKVGYDYNFKYAFHTTDEITLKTIVRSNPGLVLMKEGTIIGKWHHSSLPEIKEAEDGLLSVALQNREINRRKWVNGFFILGLASVMLFLLISLKKD